LFEWNALTAFAIVLACVAIYILTQSGAMRVRKDIDQRMREFACQATVIAHSEHQCELNYSLDSITQLDRILQALHAQHLQTPYPEKELSRIVLTWGGYLGMVIKKEYGGTWQTDSLKTGKNTYPLCWNDQEAAPVMWCLQQIRNGKVSSVASKIEAFNDTSR